jgi:hypothetical protein
MIQQCGIKIRELRKEQKFLLRHLAYGLGVDRSIIREIEKCETSFRKKSNF